MKENLQYIIVHSVGLVVACVSVAFRSALKDGLGDRKRSHASIRIRKAARRKKQKDEKGKKKRN